MKHNHYTRNSPPFTMKQELSFLCKANMKLAKKVGKETKTILTTRLKVLTAHAVGISKNETLLTKISSSPNHKVYKTTFKYRTVTNKHLMFLAQHPQISVRMALAQTRHKLPGTVLVYLAIDKNVYVRQAVARRKDINIIPILYVLNTADTRAILLRNTHIEEELKHYL